MKTYSIISKTLLIILAIGFFYNICSTSYLAAKNRSIYYNLLQQAKQAAKNKEYKKAKKLYIKILKRFPYSSVANYGFGRVLLLYPKNSATKKERKFKRKQDLRAIRHLRLAVKQDPNRAKNHFYLGFAYYFAGYQDLAVFEFQRSVQLDPSFYESYYNIGMILEERRLFVQSKKNFNLFLKRLQASRFVDRFDEF